MYSVEDLLISHGYKPARDAAAPCEDKSERCRSTRTGPRAGQGLLNGYKDGATAHTHSRTSLGTGHVSNSENRISRPRGHREHQSTSRTPEARFLNQPSLAWSSQPQSGRDDIYWSRGRQEGSGSLCPRDWKELESRGMAQAYSLPVHVRENLWEVAGRTEHVMKNAIWEEELRMQDMSLESWKKPRELGRQASDGDGRKRPQEKFEGLYPFVHGEHTSQNRKKSQSLPRALSPKSLNFTEIPVPLHDGHITGVPKVPPYPPSFPSPSEPMRNLEKASSSGPFPRPKFGKPLKTPCYSSHSQPRGEGGFQDHQHRDPRGSYPTRSKDPSHELGMLDPGLEPPVYVPPPSYRSPPQHIPNPYLEDPVPRHVSSNQSQQQVPEKPETSCPLPSGSLAARDLYDAMPGSPPQGLPPQPYPIATHGGSIQYIPFDDPRIRHIKLAQPPEFYEEAKLDDTSYNPGLLTTQEPAIGKRQYDDAPSVPRGPTPSPVNEQSSAFVHSSPRWLQGQLPLGIGPGGFHGQTEHHVMGGLTTNVTDIKAEQPEDCADSRTKSWALQGTRTAQQPAGLALENVASPDRRLNDSQSWNEEPKPGHSSVHPQSLGPSQEEGSRGVPVQWADGSLTAEQKSQEDLNGMCERDFSPRPVSRIAPIDTKAAPLYCLSEPRGSQELTKFGDAVGSVQLGRETPTQVGNGGDTEVLPCVLLPLADKYRGHSTPDFRSLELTLGQEQNAYKLECLDLENTVEVLPSESLQERAERILGIEVAVESLLPSARRTEQSQLPEPDASACNPSSSREDSSHSLALPVGPKVATDAFYGRRKCGWTESPLFVGERAPQASICSDVDGFPTSQATSPEPGKKDEEAKAPFKSTLFHFMEKSTNVVGPEKRLRNPSKVVENLQEKLVSPPKKADSVHLIRMREVNSLSQMRCLSSKSADSVEEPDPLKVIKSSAWLSEGLTSLGGKDEAWQAGHLPSVSQNENGHPEVPRDKMSDQDLWCADSYDPSRVERV